MPTDLNFAAVTGTVQGHKLYSDSQYPWAWIRLRIGRVPYLDASGEPKHIEPSTLFLNFSVPKTKMEALDRVEKGKWLAVWELVLDDYKKDDKTLYKLRGSVSKFIISDKSMPNINITTIAGRVSDQSKDGNWYRMGMSYLNPMEKDQRKKWKMRFAKIYSPYLELSVGSRYLVVGGVCGTDPEGKDGLIVVANTAVKGA